MTQMLPVRNPAVVTARTLQHFGTDHLSHCAKAPACPSALVLALGNLGSPGKESAARAVGGPRDAAPGVPTGHVCSAVSMCNVRGLDWECD